MDKIGARGGNYPGSSSDMTMAMLFLVFAASVACGGYQIIKSFSGGIQAMQASTEARWARDEAIAQAKASSEKDQTATSFGQHC